MLSYFYVVLYEKSAKNAEREIGRKRVYMKCRNCGNELSPGAKFCGSCGTKVEPEFEQENQKIGNIQNVQTQEQTELPNISLENMQDQMDDFPDFSNQYIQEMGQGTESGFSFGQNMVSSNQQPYAGNSSNQQLNQQPYADHAPYQQPYPNNSGYQQPQAGGMPYNASSYPQNGYSTPNVPNQPYGMAPEPNQQPKKKSSRMAVVIGSVAAVLCLAGGGLVLGKTFLTKDDSEKKESTQETAKKDEEEQPKKTTKVDGSDTEEAKEEEKNTKKQETQNEEKAAVPDASKETAQKKQNESGSVYKILVEDCSWSDAFDKCITMGGHLVNIDSKEEFQTICKQIKKQNLTDVHFYVGGAADGNQYYWVDSEEYYIGDSLNPEGSSWLAPYWMENEPSFESDGEKENVMCLLNFKKKWVFNDVPDNISSYYPGKTGYICEIERE